MCRVCNYHIKGLRSLRTSLDSSTAETIGRSIVMSRLDYCNSLLIGTSRRNIHRLQMVQNNLARVVSGVNFRENVHQVLTALHWLPVEQRIKFKVNVLVFKSRINCLPDLLSIEGFNIVQFSAPYPIGVAEYICCSAGQKRDC